MHILLTLLIGTTASILALSVAEAQEQPHGRIDETPLMTFFVTSVGSGYGGNLGGLAGADRHCQMLAVSTETAAADKSWHAYLSTSPAGGRPAVNARDRIGEGPWHNADGDLIAANIGDLHGDTLEAARVGNGINAATALDENGERIPRSPLRHDILTGSKPDGTAYTDGTDHTCKNWTSGMEGNARIGHHDRAGSSSSWNSAHETLGCSPGLLQTWGSAGLLYCFAID